MTNDQPELTGKAREFVDDALANLFGRVAEAAMTPDRVVYVHENRAERRARERRMRHERVSKW